jgi:hypothetical protein
VHVDSRLDRLVRQRVLEPGSGYQQRRHQVYGGDWWSSLTAEQWDSRCPSTKKQSTINTGSSAVQWPGSNDFTGNSSYAVDLKFNESWFSSYDSSGQPQCLWDTIGGVLGDSWVLPSNGNGCGHPNCADPLAVTYDQVSQDCGWNWNLTVGYPWTVAVAPAQSCSLRDNNAQFQASYTH